MPHSALIGWFTQAWTGTQFVYFSCPSQCLYLQHTLYKHIWPSSVSSLVFLLLWFEWHHSLFGGLFSRNNQTRNPPLKKKHSSLYRSTRDNALQHPQNRLGADAVFRCSTDGPISWFVKSSFSVQCTCGSNMDAQKRHSDDKTHHFSKLGIMGNVGAVKAFILVKEE